MPKRKDILKKLKQAGFTFEECARHTHILDAKGVWISTIGRHVEISMYETRQIEKQTGVKLV